MRKILSVLILLVSSFCCFAQECLPIEHELLSFLESNGEEKVSITIVLKSQPNSSELRAKASACRDRKMVGEVIVNELKEHSVESQATLLEFLQTEEKQGHVANISSLWIANSVCCDATNDVIRKIASRNDIAMVGLNKEVQMLCKSSQNSIGQQLVDKARAGSPHLHVIQVGASQVWEQGYTGKNVVVAILDSGINDEHTDLKDHLWQGYADTDGDGEKDDLIHGWNFVSDNANIKDDYGHGTHCAGIICGDGTSGNTTGVAPDAILMTLKTINRSGGGSPANMIKGVQFAVENGAKILSISSGFKSGQISKSDSVALRRTFEQVLQAGVIAFVAAGNDGEKEGNLKYVDMPASCPPPFLHPDQQANSGGLSSVVCVGAVNAKDEFASFSSQGPATWQGTEYNDYLYDETDEKLFGLIRPDICAPGDLIYSLKYDNNNKYAFMSGTSQATPCVAGVAALMLEKNATLTPADICRIMETKAVKLSEKKNNYTGSGRVDALASVNAVEASEGKPFIKISSFTPEYIAQGNNRELRLVVTNDGRGACSAEATITLLTNDKFVTLPNKTILLGRLASNEIKELSCHVNIASEAVNGHTVYMKALITDGTNSWTDEFAFRVKSYAKIIGSVDASKVLPAGENISLVVDVVNEGTATTVTDTELTIKTDKSTSNYVTFVNDKATIGVIAPGETKSVEFFLNVSEDTPDDMNLQFDLYAVPDNYTEPKDLVYGFELHTDQYGYLEDGFEGWITFDASNDGRNHPWWHSSLHIKHKMESSGTDYSGIGHVVSESYCSASMQNYTMPIDNYLVSPKIKATADSEFSFKARVHSSSLYGEHFGVAVSESGRNEATAFTTIKEWIINKEQGDGWLEFSVDLSEYAGKEIYVAIRHFFTDDQWVALDYGFYVYALHVDDAEFSNVIDMSTDFVYDNYSYFSVKFDADYVNTSVEQIDDANVFIQLCGDNIAVSGVSDGGVIGLYDIGGRNIMNFVTAKKETVNIDTEKLGNGIYLVKVVQASGTVVKKVVVQ